MNKKIQSYGSLALMSMVWMGSANALTQGQFTVTSTNTGVSIPIELCLSAGNSNPNSQSGCQTFTVTGTTLGIRTTIAGMTYTNLGIKILTSGYTITGATLNPATGYYVFSGSNTADSTVTLTSTSQTTINITTAQANRFMTVSGENLTLAIQNTGNLANATNITVTDKANCNNMTVDANNCTNVAIGQSCNLILSSTTPYAPCSISIKGSNTNTVTTTVAFKYLNGWVFESNGTIGKVAADASTQLESQQWTNTSVDIPGAQSDTDGAANTTAITQDTSCSASPINCAAHRCRDIGVDWYLPAKNELDTVYNQLKVNQFGGFAVDLYWSSTEFTNNPQVIAWNQFFFNGDQDIGFKSFPLRVRCVRAFTS